MRPEDLLHTYRRIVASGSYEDVYWWYLGTTYVVLEDGAHIPVSHPETVMIYSAETVSGTEFKITWREVGYFRDPATGDMASSWFNPITGKTVDAPSRFKEGPATSTIHSTSDGLSVSLKQAHAHVHGINVALDRSPSRVVIIQRERKVRGFPDQKGVIRDPKEGGGAEAETTLAFVAHSEDLSDPDNEWVAAKGTYRFELQTVPDWTGILSEGAYTVVHGVIVKGHPGEKINSLTWDRLDQMFPGFLDKQ